MIETISKPYRFNIDKYIVLEARSSPYQFFVTPVPTLVRNRMKEKLTELNVSTKDISTKISKKELKSIENEVLQEVGTSCLNSRIPKFIFVPEELLFKISLYDFESFKLSLPLDEVEQFKQNFDEVRFSDARFIYLEEEKFVLETVQIHDPISKKTYLYTNSNLASYNDQLFEFDFSQLH